MPMLRIEQLSYSDKCDDGEFEYRHIIIPKEYAKYIPSTHLMTESEWRNLGIAQSPGWVHYMIHKPEPHILMFRRPLPPKESNKENSLPSSEGSSGESQEGSAV